MQTVAPRGDGCLLNGIDKYVFGLGEPTRPHFGLPLDTEGIMVTLTLGFDGGKVGVNRLQGIGETIYGEVFLGKEIVTQSDVGDRLEEGDGFFVPPQFAQTARVAISVDIVGGVLFVQFLIGGKRRGVVALLEEGIGLIGLLCPCGKCGGEE